MSDIANEIDVLTDQVARLVEGQERTNRVLERIATALEKLADAPVSTAPHKIERKAAA